MGDAGERPTLERVELYVQDSEVLLVLDGFEQVVDAAPLVADLLETCPALKVWSSQAALRLSGEHELAVPLLAVPKKEPLHTLGRERLRSARPPYGFRFAQ